MIRELIALVLLDENFNPGVSCSSFARKGRQISTAKLVAPVFLEELLDRQSGIFLISRNELVAPLACRVETRWDIPVRSHLGFLG